MYYVVSYLGQDADEVDRGEENKVAHRYEDEEELDYCCCVLVSYV